MQVLMLGRNATMLQMAAGPLNNAGHQTTMCLTDQEASDKLTSGSFGALVIGMAVEQASRASLKALITEKSLNVKVLEPMGPMDLPKMLTALSS